MWTSSFNCSDEHFVNWTPCLYTPECCGCVIYIPHPLLSLFRSFGYEKWEEKHCSGNHGRPLTFRMHYTATRPREVEEGEGEKGKEVKEGRIGEEGTARG